MTSPYFNRPTGSLSNESPMAGQQQALSRQKFRGIASLTHGNKTLVFRTNPNSVMWSYKLNTQVENTYGGRVVQILSTAMEDLKIVIECGLGGWDYAMRVAQFMRNMMIDQRGSGGPGTFRYTTRGWEMKVYAVSIPFQDQVTETTRQIELNFKIQEDISGVITQQTISAELARLQDRIGFSHNQFNTGTGVVGDGTTAPLISELVDTGQTLVTSVVPAIDPYARSIGVPGLNLFGLGNSVSRIAGSLGS
jgi:hypothetical protein